MKKSLNIFLAVSLILTSLVVPVWAVTVEDAVGEYLYYYDFSEGSDLSELTDYNDGALEDILAGTAATDNSYAEYEITNDGTLKMTMNTASKYGYLQLPKITYDDATRPQLVVSYRFKAPAAIAKWYMGARARDGYASDMIGMYQGKFYQNMTTWSGSFGTCAAGTWNTITCVYDNDSPYRDLYINGVYQATYEPGTQQTAENTYSSAEGGYLFGFTYNTPDLTTAPSVELDDIMIYALPEELTYQVAEIGKSSLTLQFNMIPNAVAPANFTVSNGATVATAQKDANDPRKVVLTFAKALTPGTNYTVTASGLTAGYAKESAITTDLALGTTGAVAFRTDYEASANVLYQNYEAMTSSTVLSTTNLSAYAVTGAMSVVEDTTEDTNYVRLNASSAYIRYTYGYNEGLLTKGADYAVEFRFRPNLTKNGSFFDSRESHSMPSPRFTNGNIYANSLSSEEAIGTYENGQWYTVTMVYHGADTRPSSLTYDIYLNGVSLGTYQYDVSGYAVLQKALTAEGNFPFSFRVSGGAETDTIDIDYFKITKLSDNFAMKLDSAANIAADKINVKFNNIPLQTKVNEAVVADLLTKASVKDAQGNTIAISGVEYVSDKNEGTEYETSVNLVFAERLEGETEYTLVINGLRDSMGNVLNTEKAFTTGSFIEYGALTEGSGKASITINNTTEDTQTLTLIYAGYKRNSDDSVKMTVYTAKEISVVPGEDTYSTDAIDVSGCDYTQAYLWDGMTSVVPAEIFTK